MSLSDALMRLAEEVSDLESRCETLESERDDAVDDATRAGEREEELRCAAIALEDALGAFLGPERAEASYEESRVHVALTELRSVLYGGPDLGALTRRLNELRRSQLRLVKNVG